MITKSMSLRSSERGLKSIVMCIYMIYTLSLRSSERGLKYHYVTKDGKYIRVAPFVGAWIEMIKTNITNGRLVVAPFVGAWIEIGRIREVAPLNTSLRSSERGLKCR